MHETTPWAVAVFSKIQIPQRPTTTNYPTKMQCASQTPPSLGNLLRFQACRCRHRAVEAFLSLIVRIVVVNHVVALIVVVNRGVHPAAAAEAAEASAAAAAA